MAKVTNKPETGRKLTAKQDKFCREFLKTGNQYEAYCAAYKTENMKRETIDREAVRLTKNPTIATRMQELQDRVVEKAVLTRELVINGLIANFNSAAAISDYTASNKALELLGKVDELGLFVERKQIDSDNRHHHSAEPVSAFDDFIAGIAGEPSEESSEEPVPN